ARAHARQALADEDRELVQISRGQRGFRGAAIGEREQVASDAPHVVFDELRPDLGVPRLLGDARVLETRVRVAIDDLGGDEGGYDDDQYRHGDGDPRSCEKAETGTKS